jgi:general secretion pathway protein D
MKTTTLILILFLTGLDSWAQQTSPATRQMPQRLNNNAANATSPPTMPSFPAPDAAPDTNAPATPANTAPAEETIPPGDINFQGVDVDQVLDVYAKLVGRTVLRAGLPAAQIVLKTETPLTKTEAIQALQAVLALNNISLINVGDKFVKALPSDQAGTAGADFSHANASQLPDLGSYVTRIVQLKYVKPTEMVPIIQPFAKLPNSIIAIDSNGILVLRDDAENVKRMLEMIDQVDITVPEEFISEVIPIKYAMVDDIANALNSLGGSSSAMGSATTPGSHTTVSGFNGGGGGAQNPNQPRTFGSNANGTPSSGNSFSSRLQQIISRAATGGGSGEIQVLGQTKIIADERSNSLLVFASRQDMDTIKSIVSKLDVLLSQVLIESVIMDVSLGNSWNFGVSAVQNPKNLTPSIIGGGGINNGQGFLSTIQQIAGYSTNMTGLATNIMPIFQNVASIGTNGAFASSLPGGLSYFGNIGPSWDVALQAAAADSSVTVIQRPRIQTSQAKEASFFVGETVPYVTSTYNGGSVGGDSSSYSQLSVGVELDVTPFINPDGLVVMDINQEIDDLNGTTAIQGIGNVPNTDKRTLSSEIAVKNGDTVILGGFIRSEKDKARSGVPLLQDIPLLGALFSSHSSNKTRDELLVLMRPTVLKTPELAAAQTKLEEARLPGISHAEEEDAQDERKQIEAENKLELKSAAHGADNAELFQPASPNGTIDTNNNTQPNPGHDADGNELFQPASPNGSIDTNSYAQPNP